MVKIVEEQAMIRVQLSERQQEELIKFRRQASSKDAEKALMILMSTEGKSVPQIANSLKRNQHTVRDWVKRYQSCGIKGLKRKYSPGRPKEKREKLIQYIETIISDLPLLQGYQENVWTVPLITHAAKKKMHMEVSKDTVIRALKSMGYTYKRPAKTVPGIAPSPDEKRVSVQRILGEIKELMKKKECEIYALDESHFSTEPYLVQGWFKKRWPPQDSNTSQAGKSHILWLLESNDTKILLEKVQAV
jgi:transposase